GKNRLTDREHFKGEWSQFLICHLSIELIADNLKNRIKLGEVQALKEYVIGNFIALVDSITGAERTLIRIGSPRGTLIDKFLVVGFFGKATVKVFLQS